MKEVTQMTDEYIEETLKKEYNKFNNLQCKKVLNLLHPV